MMTFRTTDRTTLTSLDRNTRSPHPSTAPARHDRTLPARVLQVRSPNLGLGSLASASAPGQDNRQPPRQCSRVRPRSCPKLFSQDRRRVGLGLLSPASEISTLSVRSHVSAAFCENRWRRLADPMESAAWWDARPGTRRTAIRPRKTASAGRCALQVKVRLGGRVAGRRDTRCPGVLWGRCRSCEQGPCHVCMGCMARNTRATFGEVAAVARVVQALASRFLVLILGVASSERIEGSQHVKRQNVDTDKDACSRSESHGLIDADLCCRRNTAHPTAWSTTRPFAAVVFHPPPPLQAPGFGEPSTRASMGKQQFIRRAKSGHFRLGKERTGVAMTSALWV